jgi:MYXO-CTERM domain-containing protein
MQCSTPRSTLAARCATLVALVAPLPAYAQQFVLVDQTYTATADNTVDSGFTFELEPDVPENFRAPTNYADGKIQVELEIEDAPSEDLALFTICLENTVDEHACLPYVRYMGAGMYEAEPTFDKLWHYDVADWTKGVTKAFVDVKNADEEKVHADAAYYPYTAHVKITIVAPEGGGDAGAGGAGGEAAAGGRGGSTAAQGGESGGGGASASTAGSSASGGSGGSGGSSAATGGSTAASAAGSSAAVAGSSARPTQPPVSNQAGSAGTSTSTAAVSGGDAGADQATSVSAQLENTSGCSVTGAFAQPARGVWPLLAFGLLALRRRGRRSAVATNAC